MKCEKNLMEFIPIKEEYYTHCRRPRSGINMWYLFPTAPKHDKDMAFPGWNLSKVALSDAGFTGIYQVQRYIYPILFPFTLENSDT